MPDRPRTPDRSPAGGAAAAAPPELDMMRMANEIFRAAGAWGGAGAAPGDLSGGRIPPAAADGSRGAPEPAAREGRGLAAPDPGALAFGEPEHRGLPPGGADPERAAAMPAAAPAGGDGSGQMAYYFVGQGVEQAQGSVALAAARAAQAMTSPDVQDPYALGKIANEVFRDRAMSCFSRAEPLQRALGAPAADAPASDPAVAPVAAPGTGAALDIESVRRDFPILGKKVNGKPLIWFDNAATTQKPKAVIDRIGRYYAEENSNVHRGAHTLAAGATDAYEAARGTVARFLGGGAASEIVFVRGTTEGINLLAQTLGRTRLAAGDEILLTQVEHHSNIVPWQFVANETGARLRVAPVDDRGEVDPGVFAGMIGPRTRIVSFTHVSNALGTVLPVREMAAAARRAGAVVIVDGAQAVPHFPVNVRTLGADFYVFSGHKVFGPTGIGAVWGRAELWDELPPWQGGGSMIDRVTFAESTYAPVPQKFEAGTGILAGAVGLAAAIDYLDGVGWDRIVRHEESLMRYAAERLRTVPGLRPVGTARHKAGVHSFVLAGHHPPDVGAALDREGIAVRAGHHCAQPTMDRFGVDGTIRPSFAFYNTHAEVDRLVEALRRIARA